MVQYLWFKLMYLWFMVYCGNVCHFGKTCYPLLLFFFRNPKTLNRKMFIEALLGSFKNIFIFPTNVVIVIITILNDPIIGFLMLHLFEKNVCYFL